MTINTVRMGLGLIVFYEAGGNTLRWVEAGLWSVYLWMATAYLSRDVSAGD